MNAPIIAVTGQAAKRARSRSGDRNHLSRDGLFTICGIAVRNRINHVSQDLRKIADCQNCWRSLEASR